MENVDVYAYGMISTSTLFLLSMPYPAADGYAEIKQSIAMTGGEALNSAIVLSRLGKRALLDGSWIGDTAEGRQLVERLETYQIAAPRLLPKKGYTGVREIVLSDDRTRTVFGNYVALLSGERKWNIPRKVDIGQAKMACIDPFFREESELAGRYAVQLGIPFVSIDCAYDHLLATRAEAIIVSGEFRNNQYAGADINELFNEYHRRAAGLVVFTVGGEDVLYARRGEPVRRLQPYPVQVVDSAGAGDSFRAGIIFGLLNGWSDAKTVRYASAVAGLVCASFPGVLNSPTQREVERFIAKNEETAAGQPGPPER